MNQASLALALQQTRAPWHARRIIALLQHLDHGSLTLRLPSGMDVAFGHGHPHATLHIHDWRCFREIVSRGDIGFAEGYIDGHWTTPDLSALLTLLARNRRAIEATLYGSWWGRAFARLRHLMNANTRRGSRKNIAAHYDLGNDFYALWLDPTMTYSSAYFAGDRTQTLAAAQTAKYQRILDGLALDAPSHILEIGCGWGGFAEHAARQGGHRVKGLTLSRAQLEYARKRMASAGLADQVELVYQDYRDERGQYDAVASIEMFEAVGEAYWPAYFNQVRHALKPGGRAVIQTILIDDALFEAYRSGTDFIQQYIFPGGMLPSSTQFRKAATRAGLEVVSEERFGLDYAETLRRWHAAFEQQIEAVRRQGFDERFNRIWRFYLAYCEAGFTAGTIDVAHFCLVRRA